MSKFKKLVSFCLIITILVSSVFLSSSSRVDPVLETATEITRKLFNSYEGEDLAIYDYIPSSYVKGLDGEEDYIISEREIGGYAIFEKDTMELIEYSPTDKSPYFKIPNKERHYAGPVNYFQGKDNEFRSLTTNKEFELEEIKFVAAELKYTLQLERSNRFVDNERGGLPTIGEAKEVKSNSLGNIENVSSETGVDSQPQHVVRHKNMLNVSCEESLFSVEAVDPGPTGVEKKMLRCTIAF